MRNRTATGLSLLTLLLSNLAFAQNPPLGISDEGGTVSYPAYKLDCVGAGISCSHSGSTGTITVTGSGSSTFTTQESDATVDAATDTLDFGSCFDLTSSPAGEANVAFDSSECTVNADALKADGANCAAGEIPLGVDASGAVQGCYQPTEADITDLDHTATAITDGLIVEPDLDADVVAVDGDFLQYDSTGTNFTWRSSAEVLSDIAASANDFDANGDVTITEADISDLTHTTDTTLSQEQVEDFAGAMVTGNTETRITVTYQDADGTVDFVVDDMNDDVPESGDFGNAADLEATGELSADVVDQSKIADNAIQEEHLKAVDAAVDEECLTYESTTGDFEWQACGSGSETNDLESVATSAGDGEIFVGTGVDTGAYITGLAACAADAKIEYVPGSPDTFTCENITITESDISDLSHTTDTNANTACTGTTTYLDGEGNCDDISSVYEPTISADSLTHSDIVDSDQADTKCFTFYESDGIDAADDLESIWANKTANDFLITEIWCETDTGTVTAMLQVDDGTPADVDTTDLVCPATEIEDTSLNGDTTVAAGEELDWAVTSTASTPLFVRVCFTGNWVD